FQAEDGIRDATVTGVQTCALPIFNQQNVNGIRTQSSYFLVDGAENHDSGANSNGIVDPNVDAIAELKMETSSYAAEFGGRAGAEIGRASCRERVERRGGVGAVRRE